MKVWVFSPFFCIAKICLYVAKNQLQMIIISIIRRRIVNRVTVMLKKISKNLNSSRNRQVAHQDVSIAMRDKLSSCLVHLTG